MSKDACRPFCKTRDGMVQGEGAAIFIFENYQMQKNVVQIFWLKLLVFQ